MQIIDAHAHIYERLSGFGPRGEARAIGGGRVEWATGEVEQFILPEHGDTGFSAETLIKLMDEGGVDRAVLLQGSNYGFQNSYVSETVKKYPDRFVGAGTLDPFCAGAERIFENIADNLNLRILKLEISQGYGLCGYHPDLKIDGGELAPILSECEKNNITLTVDTGVMDTAGFQIDGLCRVCDRYPSLTVVVAHTLFPREDGRNGKRLEYLRKLASAKVYFDVANLRLHLQEQRDYLRQAMDIVGADHLMWGSDCPGIFLNRGYRDLIDDVCDYERFSKNELTFLLGETAKKVYRI